LALVEKARLQTIAGHLARLAPRAIAFAVGALLLADLAACWVIPYRLCFGPHGSFYAFGFIGDEYTYAERMQPRLAGASGGNPVNGVSDPRYISIWYLEEFLRVIITALHLDVTTFAWVWRILFPVAFLASLVLLARACVPPMGRRWERTLRLAACGAVFPLIFCVYEEVTVFPPFGGFIHRFPSGIEYVIAALVAWAYIRFLRTRSPARGAVLALFGAAMIYLRPYAAIAWAPALAIPLLVLVTTRAMPLRSAAATVATLVLALAPWVAIKRWDEHLPVYQDLWNRYLNKPEHNIHPRWPVFAVFAILFLFAAWLAKPWWRPFALGAAAALFVLPLTVTWLPMAGELLGYDRFGVLYLTAAAATALLLIGQRTPPWNERTARRWTIGLVACGALAWFSVWERNVHYDFLSYPLGPLKSVRPDIARIPAYLWIRANTRPDALFLAELPRFGTGSDTVDLFGTVARRRRVFTSRLSIDAAMTNAEYESANRLYFATIGDRAASPADYARAYGFWKPDYVLWHKDGPVPRGSGKLLEPFREVVYSDASCEIWRMKQVDLQQLALGK
jgi:hypothetical protein